MSTHSKCTAKIHCGTLSTPAMCRCDCAACMRARASEESNQITEGDIIAALMGDDIGEQEAEGDKESQAPSMNDHEQEAEGDKESQAPSMNDHEHCEHEPPCPRSTNRSAVVECHCPCVACSAAREARAVDIAAARTAQEMTEKPKTEAAWQVVPQQEMEEMDEKSIRRCHFCKDQFLVTDFALRNEHGHEAHSRCFPSMKSIPQEYEYIVLIKPADLLWSGNIAHSTLERPSGGGWRLVSVIKTKQSYTKTIPFMRDKELGTQTIDVRGDIIMWTWERLKP